MSSSIACDHCQSPCICVEWMWEPFHVGLEPQPPLHNIISWCTSVTHQRFQLTSQIGAKNRCFGNKLMTGPKPHQLHTTIVNHLLCMCNRNHSMWVWSLNQCAILSFGVHQLSKIISADFPNWSQQVCWQQNYDRSISLSSSIARDHCHCQTL
jgi:hypothetical protein